MSAGSTEAHCERCGTAIRAGQIHCPRCHPSDAVMHFGADDLRLSPTQLAAVPHPPTVQETVGSWSRPAAAHAAERRPSHPPPAMVGERPSHPPPSLEPERRPSHPPPPLVSDGMGEAAFDATGNPVSVNPEDTLDHEPPDATDLSLHPPVLASQALMRALLPPEPGDRGSRRAVTALGLLGAALAVWLLGWVPEGAPVLVGYVALATLGALPMAYVARAATLLTLSTMGLGAVSLLMLDSQLHAPRQVALVFVVVLLGTGLHYRAWHRGSRIARLLVATGIAAAVLWLSTMGGLAELGVLDSDIRTWLPRLLELPLGLLLMIALLAFMDGRTTGGCGVWAVLVWLWHGADVLAELMAQAPAGQSLLSVLSGHPVPSMVALTSALLAPIVGLSAAQLLASTFAHRR